ncbi:alpha/beta fold hydrolase [Calditrichota bacterium]
MTENLTDYCAQGASFNEEMIAISENVSLRFITFKPAEKKNNPAIVFVPGWVSQMIGWREVLLELTKDFTVYYLETREKISSVVKGNVRYSIEEMGKDIVEVINLLKLKEKEYLIFGSSLGATLILDCCRFLKRKPLALILVGPNAVFRVPRIWKAIVTVFYPPLYNLLKPSVKWYLRNFRLDLESDYAQYEKYSNTLDVADPWKLKKAVLSVAKYEVWDLLKSIDIPTLIIGASKDKLHEPDNLRRIVSLLKNQAYINLETNTKTHSKEMVYEMRKYIDSLKK